MKKYARAVAVVAVVGLGIVSQAAPAAAGNTWLFVDQAVDTAKGADSQSDEGNSWLWAAVEDAIDTAENFQITIGHG